MYEWNKYVEESLSKTDALNKDWKVSSSHHWLLALAANAYLEKNIRGIQAYYLYLVHKLLKYNFLSF